jgi:hypothetical protein
MKTMTRGAANKIQATVSDARWQIKRMSKVAKTPLSARPGIRAHSRLYKSSKITATK